MSQKFGGVGWGGGGVEFSPWLADCCHRNPQSARGGTIIVWCCHCSGVPPLPAQQFCIRPPRRCFRIIHGVLIALRGFTAMPYGQVHCTLISGRGLKDQDLFGKMGRHVQDFLHFGRFTLVCRPLLQHPKRGWCDRAGEVALQDAQQWRQNPKLEREKNVQCCRRGRQTDVAML